MHDQFPEEHNRPIELEVLEERSFLESDMRSAFAFDGANVASALFERLCSFGAYMGGVGETRENAGDLFTSRI